MANYERLENNEVKFDLSIPAEEFEKGMQFAFTKERGKYSVPGFRKGKVPRAIIEKNFGEGVFYENAFDHLYWDVYIAAVDEAGITPVDSPNIDVVQIGTGQELLFTATVAVLPEFEVSKEQYTGVEIEKVDDTVKEEDIDAQIEREREQQVRYVEVDRPIQDGDRVQLDYSGSVDGVVFEGGTAENQMLEIGSGQFIPGFEEQLVGMEKDQEGEVKVTFPEDYNAEELAGKEAIFEVKILDIKEKELPILDDEFVKDISDFDTLEEYRADVKSKMQENSKEQAKKQIRNVALDAIVENVEFDVPESMIQRQVDRMVENMDHQLQSSGLTAEQYFSFMGMDLAAARAQMIPDANKKVRADLIIEKIVEMEKFVGDDEDVEAEVAKIAESVGKTVDEVKEMLTERDFESIKTDLASKKAVDYIIEKAVFVEPTEIKEEDLDKDENSEENIDSDK